MTTLDQVKVKLNGLRVRYLSDDADREPQGTITDSGYGAVTITWDDGHSPSNVPRNRWHVLEVL